MLENSSLFVQVPALDINTYTPDEKVLPLITESMAERLKAMPLFQVKTTLVTAMADPADFIALNELKRETKLEILPVAANESELREAISRFYANVDNLQEELDVIVKDLDQKTFMSEVSKTINKPRISLEEDTPVIRLVDTLIRQAIKIKASDIHIEPEETKFRLRYRVDGILQEMASFPSSILPSLISRIKIISGLDITETRVPQDGRSKLTINNRDVDLRISTFPTIHGENIVIRVLDKSVLALDLENLGVTPALLEEFLQVITSPYGIVLVAGPTGSGKTTTLYGVLNKVNTVQTNIVTLEDPVEYNLPLIRQTQINPKIGLTFASGLRSLLRQDPDVILVGEIRDLETSEIAIQAALTGHLVFSTVHTNDAASTLARLIDMGVEPFLLSSSVNAIIAQRLVRQVCPECKEEYQPDQEILKTLGILKGTEQATYYKGKGCMRCRKTGYSGRIGLFELMRLNDPIRELVVKKAPSAQIRQAAIENGMVTMFDDGLQKVREGKTTLDEVLRVTKLNTD